MTNLILRLKRTNISYNIHIFGSICTVLKIGKYIFTEDLDNKS